MAVTPLQSGAFPALWEEFSDDDGSMWTYMSVGPFSGREEMEEVASPWLGSPDPLFFTFDMGGKPRGWGAYLRIEPAHGVLEVGHLAFGPSLRRTPAATEAMYLMMRHVFRLGYRRYEWKCDSLNHASRRAAERLGFTYEGTFRHHMVYKGRNRDTAWYSIIDRDWPLVGQSLEAWLEPSNFDRHGVQRRRLSEIREEAMRNA
ncbi:MAG: GNAT family N-acetyltransferase [Actinomycetota bacterium]